MLMDPILLLSLLLLLRSRCSQLGLLSPPLILASLLVVLALLLQSVNKAIYIAPGAH